MLGVDQDNSAYIPPFRQWHFQLRWTLARYHLPWDRCRLNECS